MAIALEAINLIIPRTVIERKYPGGWEACLAEHAESIGWRMWHDDHLLRDGAMNPMAMAMLLADWEERGFRATDRKRNPTRWRDLCVIGLFEDASRLACSWLEIEDGVAWRSGEPPGPLIYQDRVLPWRDPKDDVT
jgi:hypothetical protein